MYNTRTGKDRTEAGACAVMALERIPADIRAAGGVSRMSDPKMIAGIQEAVTIPVMAKCRIGHFAEAQVLEAIEIDYIDESEVLSPADDVYHINKRNFKVPFVCGAKDLGEALRRINEGASMIRTKGEPGTGDIVQAVRHMRKMNSQIAQLVSMREDELFEAAKQLRVPYDLVVYVHENGKLPVRKLRSRWSRNTSGCSLNDAVRSRRSLRRIRNLQIWKPSQTSSSDRTGSDKLYRCQTNRRIIQRPWGSNGRNQRTGNRIINGRKRKIR